MVLLILIAIWTVVLVPPWVRGRREGRPAESIVSFQRRLSSLERTAPHYSPYATYSDDMYVDSSYLDDLDEGEEAYGDVPARRGGVSAGAVSDLMWAEAEAETAGYHEVRGPVGPGAAAAYGVAGQPVARLRRPASFGAAATAADVAGSSARAGSRVALHRRRQIFFGLLLGVAVSLGVAGFVQSFSAWAVHAGFGVLFLGYVMLLVRHHHQALERAVKVHHISPIRAPRPAVVVLRSGTAR